MKQYADREAVTEELKMNDQMEWVCQMNGIRDRVIKVIMYELIFVD